VIDSPELAAELLRLIEIDRLHSAYRVRRNAQGGCCEWVEPDSADKNVMTVEPDSSWWQRWLGNLVQPLAPEDHL
jgi:cardiolipin synthase C